MPRKPQITADPLTNRGTAFTTAERARLGIMGRLPSAVETLDQQAARVYKQLGRLEDDLDKYIYLEQLHDRNEVLYYKVVIDHIAELLPVIYDPTIGEAIKKWSAAPALSTCPWTGSRTCDPHSRASASDRTTWICWSSPTPSRSSASGTGE